MLVMTVTLTPDQRYLLDYDTDDQNVRDIVHGLISEVVERGANNGEAITHILVGRLLEGLYNAGYGERFDTPASPGHTGGMITLIKRDTTKGTGKPIIDLD